MRLNRLIFIVVNLFFFIQVAHAQDDKDLSASAFPEADCIELEITGGQARRCGETCFDLVVSNFKNVSSMQFSINFDPRLLEFVQIVQKNYDLPSFRISKNLNVQAPNGVIRCTWDDPASGDNTLPDGTVLFSMCYKAIGQTGDSTQIRLTDVPILIEFTDGDGEELCYTLTDYNIYLEDAISLCVQSDVCSTTGSTGSISIRVDGGNLDYTVTCAELGSNDIINTQGGSVTYNNLTPGTYNINVRDASGKDTSFVLEVSNVDPIQIDIDRVVYPDCKNPDRGSIKVFISGGAGNPDSFAINWQPGNYFGTRRLGRLKPGIYKVTVIDSLGCESSREFDLTARYLNSEVNVLQASSCSNSTDGVVEAKGTKGKPFPGGLYKFTWSKPGADCTMCATSTNSGIFGSNQWVIIEDAKGCMDTLYFDIPFMNELTLDGLQITNTACAGDTTGGFVATILGNNSNVGVFSFTLVDLNNNTIPDGVINANTYISPALVAGRYILESRHDNGCLRIDTITISSPPPIDILLIDIDSISSCSVGYDAYIEVNARGGNQGIYTYNWSNDSVGSRVDGLSPGTYTVTATDSKGCSSERTFVVTGAIGPSIVGFSNTVHILCKGDSIGQTTVEVQAGNSRIVSYKWSNGKTQSTVYNLKAGKYYVTIEDENGCSAEDSVIITEPADAFRVSNFNVSPPICPNDVNGRITVTIEGGTAPYTYTWSDGSNAPILNNIPKGSYSVTIEDASGICPPITESFTLEDPPHINIELVDSSLVSCNNDITCDASWQATASGGKDPSLNYTFIWASGDVNRNTVTGRSDNLCQGSQILIVSNENCADTINFEVGAPEKIRINPINTVTEDVTCFGDSNGVARLQFTGGTSPYNLIWQNDNRNETSRTDLKAGVYQIIIRDINNCIVRDSLEINQPDLFEVSTVDNLLKSVRCNGSSDGRIVLQFEGGNPGPKQLIWSPNVVGDSLVQNLSAGTYLVVARDVKGCVDSLSVEITEPPLIDIEMPLPEPPDCFGEQIALSVLNASGGNGPEYVFTINNGEKHNLGDSVDLFAGSYMISVFDEAGCSKDTFIDVDSPDEIMVTFDENEIEVELGDTIEVCLESVLEAGDTVIWTPEARTTRADGSCIIIDATDNITYTAAIRNTKGCEALGELRVRIINRGRVYIPNAFAPESLNNAFKVFTGVGVASIDFMRVYNRWGGLVFEQENLIPEVDGWNGRLQNTGIKQPSGVYVYLIQVTYKNGERQLFRSDITLIR